MTWIINGIVFLSLTLLLPTSPAYPLSLEFVPSTQNVSPGSPTEVDIRISGLGNLMAPSLGTYDFNVNFDPTILSFSSVTFGDPVLGDQLDLFGLGSIAAATPGSGFVNLFELSLDSVDDLNNFQASTFILASLFFDTIGSGISPLSFTINALGNADGEPLMATPQNGSVTAASAALPEPTSATLLLLGLVMLAVRATSKAGTENLS